jgi:hypothetical protein
MLGSIGTRVDSMLRNQFYLHHVLTKIMASTLVCEEGIGLELAHGNNLKGAVNET